jgi:hypothetical protein
MARERINKQNHQKGSTKLEFPESEPATLAISPSGKSFHPIRTNTTVSDIQRG